MYVYIIYQIYNIPYIYIYIYTRYILYQIYMYIYLYIIPDAGVVVEEIRENKVTADEK
jgi:hypothetical protein